MSFYVKTDEPEFTATMKDYLRKLGYKEKRSLPVDFLFLSGKASYYSSKVDTHRTKWLSLLYGNSVIRLTDKANLHKYYKNAPFLIPTHLLSASSSLARISFENPKILKPSAGWHGSGIRIVQSKQEASEWIQKHPQYTEWLLQDYILNPALLDGYKFHLRVFVLVKKPHSSERQVFVANHGFYAVANKKYSKSLWMDTDIHDTHYNPDKLELFPNTPPDGWSQDQAKRSIIKLFKIFKTLLKDETQFNTVWNSENGFEVFGADILFKGHTPYLLEFNTKIGLAGKSLYASGIVQTVLSDEPNEYFTRIL